MNTNIISCIITGVITLTVCLINNAVQIRKHREESTARMQSQIDEIKETLNEIMSDMTARIEEIIANQEASQVSIRKDIEHLTYRVIELDSKVDKHNNVIERTYNLEKNTEVLQEKMRVANARISDLEHENEKRS